MVLCSSNRPCYLFFDQPVLLKVNNFLWPAYIIVEISIHDPKGYEEYKKLAPASIAAFGGEFLIRGGKIETLEGDWTPERIVVVEFPDMETAKK